MAVATDPRMVKVEAEYYQQFDADLSREVPAEGYAGWKRAEIELPLAHTALVVMHAWDCGTAAQYPGWWRSIEYFPRADRIAKEVFPPLLAAVRRARMKLFHVVGPGEYFKNLPGYVATKELAGPEPAPLPQVVTDPATAALREFRAEHIAFGKRNQADIDAGYKRMDFPEPARPVGDEPVAENAHQLAALCRHHGISHLVYVGFAINWCLLMSPGGMLDMRRHGLLCSTIKEATTAVENKESARGEVAKQLALWRTSIAFGFVFSVKPFVTAVAGAK